jgi:hypothetical protein
LEKVFKIKAEGNWLLSGLMVHAGYNPPTTEREEYIPETEGKANLIARLARRIKRWF